MAFNTKWCPALRKQLLAELALAPTDEMACKAVNIGYTTLKRWIRDSEAGKPEFARFSTEVINARNKRYKNVLMRLPGYRDWRADDAYLKHLRYKDLQRAKVKQAKAEARRAEAEADRSESLAGIARLKFEAERDREDEAGMSRLLVPEDVLELIARQDPELFERVEGIFQTAGVAPMVRGDLGAGITVKDLREASPSPIPEEVS
jgi:hypothetical protein